MFKYVLLAILSGCLYAISNVGFGIWPLVFIYLIPLWFALDSLSSKPSSSKPLKSIATLGFIFGLSAFIVGFPWLLSLSDNFLGSSLVLGYILWLGLGLWFALSFAVYTLLYHALRKAHCAHVIAATSPLVLIEWCQTNLFPSYSGAALIAKPILAQIADLGGPLLLSTFVVIINSCIYVILKSRLKKQFFPARHLLACLSLIVLVVIYGQVKIDSFNKNQSEKPLRIGAVQTNLVMLEKEMLSIKSHPAHLQQSRELLKDHIVDLLIWPETAYVRGLRRPLPIDAQFIRADIKTPLLFGGTSVWQKEGRRTKSNSVFLANSAGTIDQVYDKTLLIPFAEYMPFMQWLQPYQEYINILFPHSQNFYSDGNQQALQLNDIQIITPICYEIIHPDFIREQVKRSQPQLLITLANDAWFGDSQEPWIHLSLARLRAIEHRLWIVRATNSGISAIIDPSGNITAQTGLHTKENLVGNVYPQHSLTLYTQYGNWVAWLALLLSLQGLYRLLFNHKPLGDLAPSFFSNR